MELYSNFGSGIVLVVALLLIFVQVSIQDTKELSLEDIKLCSPIIKLKVKYESLLVTQGRSGQHSTVWDKPEICKFEVQSVYSKGGVVAVIQKLHLRRNLTSGECIDYIQFRSKKGANSQRHCGFLDARLNMNYHLHNAPDSLYPEYFPVSYSNSFIDLDGGMDVIVFIAKQPLEGTERTDFAIVFTSYVDCSKHSRVKHVALRECGADYTLSICMNKDYFRDGYINCPYFGCVDEGGCSLPLKPEGNMSVGDKVLVGSISTLCILFATFILIIWAFRKHKLFCWAEEFAHPTSTPQSNRHSRVVEMSDQTGARLAESQSTTIRASAPTPEEDKDLPPSYDSLFPDAENPR